jgi:predicted neuraminidase
MIRDRASLLAFLLVPALATMPGASAQNAGPRKQLLDPSVAKFADGVERYNRNLQAAETYLPILYPSSHAANLYELNNGDVLCVWFSGTWEGSSGVGIVIARRPHGSRNWGAPVLIDRQEGVSFQNPVLFQEPNGTIDLYHSTQEADAGEANAHVLHLVSKDNGVTWSKPELLFGKPGAFTRHPVVILKDGSWMLPLSYITSAGIGQGSETNYSATEISKDRGATWKECLMAGSQGKIQPSVVSLGLDRLIAFFRSRTSDFIYSSTSPDGCTWSPATATALPNNNASIQAFRLRDGHLVMAFNNSSKVSGGLRKPVSVALSLDEGKTWPYVRDVEEGRPGYGIAEQTPKEPGREEYSYPSIIQARSGEILVAFTWRRQTIKVVAITEDWIRQQGTDGEFKGQR